MPADLVAFSVVSMVVIATPGQDTALTVKNALARLGLRLALTDR
jgi:threonine/homoserine/homoserine lactone efflux protein